MHIICTLPQTHNHASTSSPITAELQQKQGTCNSPAMYRPNTCRPTRTLPACTVADTEVNNGPRSEHVRALSIDIFIHQAGFRSIATETSGQSNFDITPHRRHTWTDGSVVFARWRQCPPPIPSNTGFLGPTRVHISNGISIGSADFAGLTTVTDRQTTLLRV